MSYKSFLALVSIALLSASSYAAGGHVSENRPERGDRTEERGDDGVADDAVHSDEATRDGLERIGRGEHDARGDLESRGAGQARAAGVQGRARNAEITAAAEKAFAKSGDLELNESLDLGDFGGKTFYQAMTGKGGINEKLEKDIEEDFTVPGADAIHGAAESFEPSVYKKVTDLFKDGEEGLDKLVGELEGQKYNPETVVPAIRNVLSKQKLLAKKFQDKTPLAAVMIAPFLSLASGGGTFVKLDAHNHFLNIGYKKATDDPELLAKAVKSGRSFGVSNGHKALDASDVYYLNSLDSYLSDAKSATGFYKTILDTLTSCDTSGLRKLTQDGQAVATDFFAVYTAELDRHYMTGMTKHPWENDLAEVTFLSAYSNAAGVVSKDGLLTEGVAKDWFGVSSRGGGSGIGMTRRDRMALQRKVTAAEREIHPEVVEKLETLLGLKEGSDVIHGLMDYLNTGDNQADVRKNSSELLDAATEFLKDIRADADDITKAIKKGEKKGRK